MKYYIIAGEASGDLHASNLIKEIKRNDPQAHFRCWGGDLMKSEGADIVKHYRDLAFMGFLEVISNLRTILKNIDFCKNDILQYQPDVLILVDYPGFNLRIAEFAHNRHFKVVYYISPQIWAWKQSRIKKIKRDVDLMMVILPFEQEFYQKFNYSTVFVGHPLLDAIENKTPVADFRKENNLGTNPIISLLPGSRKQEISVMLPIMINAVKSIRGYHFVIAGAPSISKEFYKELINEDVTIVYNQTYNLLQNSEAALVTSGTATLETALFNVPQVVCYKGNKVSYLIARQLIKIKYISLVNLIMDREVVKELIQDELHIENISFELKKILPGGENRINQLKEYAELKNRLGGHGASARAASEIMKFLSR